MKIHSYERLQCTATHSIHNWIGWLFGIPSATKQHSCCQCPAILNAAQLNYHLQHSIEIEREIERERIIHQRRHDYDWGRVPCHDRRRRRTHSLSKTIREYSNINTQTKINIKLREKKSNSHMVRSACGERRQVCALYRALPPDSPSRERRRKRSTVHTHTHSKNNTRDTNTKISNQHRTSPRRHTSTK